MAIPTGGPTEPSSPSTEVTCREPEDIPVHMKSDRMEEVPALLGMTVIADDEEPESATGREMTPETAIPVSDVNAAVEADDADSATDPVTSLPDTRYMPAPVAEPERTTLEQRELEIDLKKIRESLHDSLADTRYISAKIDAVSSETDGLIKHIDDLSLKYELLTAEIAATSSSATTKRVLSKTFLTLSSMVIVLLAAFQIYTFMLLLKTERLQNATGSSVLENVSSLNKKMADYNKNLAKALENQVHKEQAQPKPAAAEKTDHTTHGTAETGPAPVTSVQERLNRLRNGLPEKKLFRRETGDWFVFNKKNDECISDVEVIDTLNQAYKKIGGSLSITVPLPSHKALCVLKPDGKGGTQVVMTKDFLP